MAYTLFVFTHLLIVVLALALATQNATPTGPVLDWFLEDFTLSPIVISEEQWFPSDVVPLDGVVFRPEALCSSLSCEKENKEDLCRCDDMCKYYGDCCWNVANAREEFPPSYPPNDLLGCRPLPGLRIETGVNNSPKGYFMVSLCPEGTSDEIKQRCEEEPDATVYIKSEMFLPIKEYNGFIYKNIFCARCNGVNESHISTWEVSHFCRSCPASLSLLPEYKVQLSDTNCSLSATLPWLVRSCLTGLVDSCPLDFNHTEVITKCHSYKSLGIWNSTWYKNIHCAICNGLVHFLDYECHRVEEYVHIYGNEGGIQDDLFRVWALNTFVYMKTTPAVKEELPEIRRLSHCTRSYPQYLYLVVTSSSHQLQSRSCPYFEKRLEKCVVNELERLRPNGIELPWRQMVRLSNADPFVRQSTLFFHIPQSFAERSYFESIFIDIYSFLMRSKDDCMFQDMYLLRVCGNLSSPEEGIAPCKNLLEFNSSQILAKIGNDDITEFLNPWTMETVSDVLRYGFHSIINRSEIQAYKTEICQLEQQWQTTLKTELDKFATMRPSEKRRSRLTQVEQIFSNMCISLSVTCLFITFTTYCIFPILRNSFGITLMNFVAAFALGQFFIHFVTDYVTQWSAVCTTVAIVTHLVWLSTFAWMNLLAWNLKSTFDNKKLRAINYTSRKTMLVYFCYGWIVPLCAVSVCCTFFFVFSDTIPITYGLIQGVTCWIGSGWVSFAVVIGPLAVVIIVNGVLFTLIVNGIRRSRFRPQDPEERLPNNRGKIAELLIYIKISLLMGFVWVLGFFISSDESRIIWYIYYTLQASQGILIMLLFAFNQRVRNLWRSKLKTVKQRSVSSHTRESSI